MASSEIKPVPGHRGPGTQPSNRGFILVVVAIVVIGLAAVAVIATNRNDTTGAGGGEDGAQTAAVELIGETLTPMPEGAQVTDAETDPEAETVAPTLIGTGFDGSGIRIEPDGSPKAVYFLAHWCSHCQEEVPAIQDLIDAGALPAGMELFAVSTSVNAGRGNYPPVEWLAREGFTPPVVRDDDRSSAFAGFGGSSFPYVVYLDADHRVVARSAGNLDGDTTRMLWELAASST